MLPSTRPGDRRLASGLCGALTVALSGALALPVIARLWRSPDTATHLAWALEVCRGLVFASARRRPHVLYPWLICGLLRLPLGLDLETAARWVAVGDCAAAGAVVLAALRGRLGPPRRALECLRESALSVSLLLVAPISLLVAGNFYFGFVPLLAFHNPTMQLLRPLALWLFVLAVPLLTRDAPAATRPRAMALLIASVLGTFAKPSFSFAFLPALLVAFAWAPPRLAWTPGRRSLAAWVVAPASLAIVVQALLYLKAGGVVWAPLEVERYLLALGDPGHEYAGLSVRFLASTAFPIAVLALHRAARRDPGLRLAWVTFGFGAALAYLFAEGGDSRYHGNFTWSAQIGLLVLFVQSAIFLAGAPGSTAAETAGARERRVFCWGLFALHLATGLLWYGVNAFDTGLPAWPPVLG